MFAKIRSFQTLVRRHIVSEQIGVVVTLDTCIREVLGSNTDRVRPPPEVFRVLLSLSRGCKVRAWFN